MSGAVREVVRQVTITDGLIVGPGPDCTPDAWCPLLADGSYHGSCLWHRGDGTCTNQERGHTHG